MTDYLKDPGAAIVAMWLIGIIIVASVGHALIGLVLLVMVFVATLRAVGVYKDVQRQRKIEQ